VYIGFGGTSSILTSLVYVPDVADVAGQLVAAGHPVGGEAKAHALNPAGKDYVLCNHTQLIIDY